MITKSGSLYIHHIPYKLLSLSYEREGRWAWRLWFRCCGLMLSVGLA